MHKHLSVYLCSWHGTWGSIHYLNNKFLIFTHFLRTEEIVCAHPYVHTGKYQAISYPPSLYSGVQAHNTYFQVDLFQIEKSFNPAIQE